MLIFPAYASDPAVAAAGGGSSLLGAMAPLLVIFVIFYFFLVRPQQKRIQEYQKLVSGLRRGDRIVTTGGIIGTITKVEDKGADVMVEIAEGVRIRLQRSAIAEVLAKTAPVADESSTDKKPA